MFLQQMGVPCVVSSFRNMSWRRPTAARSARRRLTFFKARATCIGANASSYWAEALRPSGECRAGRCRSGTSHHTFREVVLDRTLLPTPPPPLLVAPSLAPLKSMRWAAW